jgi:hypothetical protein
MNALERAFERITDLEKEVARLAALIEMQGRNLYGLQERLEFFLKSR